MVGGLGRLRQSAGDGLLGHQGGAQGRRAKGSGDRVAGARDAGDQGLLRDAVHDRYDPRAGVRAQTRAERRSQRRAAAIVLT